MNYKIINDEGELDKFLNWLPFDEQEHLYISLLCRKKYCPEIPNNNQQLRRFVVQKKHIKQRIAQLESPEGSFKIDDFSVPNHALALYVSINPRSLWRASCAALKEIADVISRGDKNVDPIELVTNCVQKSAGEKRFIVFDIDDKNPTLLETAFSIVGAQSYIETRGGYHLLIDSKKIAKSAPQNWYLKLKEFSDVSGDELSPIPGSTQGGFIPRFYANAKSEQTS